MDRRAFIGMVGVLAAVCWFGVRRLFGAGDGRQPREAMHYRKLDG